MSGSEGERLFPLLSSLSREDEDGEEVLLLKVLTESEENPASSPSLEETTAADEETSSPTAQKAGLPIREMRSRKSRQEEIMKRQVTLR